MIPLKASAADAPAASSAASQPAKYRAGSEVHLDEWVAPTIADDHGFLRAGQILEWMDVVGVLAATRHCHRPVVTASVDGMDLMDPIPVGSRVTLTAAVAYTSERSIGVSVTMRHGKGDVAASRRVVDAYMTFVALDDDGRPERVPQFHPETPGELARSREGAIRREFRQKLASGEMPSVAEAEHADSVPRGSELGLFVREWLKVVRGFRMPWERTDEQPKPRTRHVSYIHKIEPIRVGKLNFHGTLYGGTLMRWIESAASLSARAYLADRPVRLAGLHGLNFIKPAPRDLFVHIRSVVVHTAGESVTTLVEVRAEDPIAGAYFDILRAFLTYVPLGASGAAVPPLECTGEDERALFREVEQRHALRRALLRAEELFP